MHKERLASAAQPRHCNVWHGVSRRPIITAHCHSCIARPLRDAHPRPRYRGGMNASSNTSSPSANKTSSTSPTGGASQAQVNRRTVERFLASGHGDALLHRHELFCTDAISGLWTTDSGAPAYAQGRDNIATYDVWSSQHFPDWEWFNVHIWTTDDPDWLWAEADGRGTVILPGHDPVHYENHFLYSFEMCDGLIAREREFMNPIIEMKALGLTTPTIDLGDFPQA